MTRHPDSPDPRGGAVRLARTVLPLALIGVIGLLVDHIVQLRQRFDNLEVARLDESLRVRRGLDGMRDGLFGLRDQLEESTSLAQEAARLSRRIIDAEEKLGGLDEQLAAQASSLEEIQRSTESFGPEILRQELVLRDEHNQSRWESLNELAASAHEAATASQLEIQRLEAGLRSARDVVRMWRDIVGPVVQLAGDVSVGSGVLLHSEPDAESGIHRTHLLTAWHVVRDIQGDLENTGMPVPVFIYDADGDVTEERAELLVFNPDLDAALLVLTTESPLESGAAMASRERLEDVRIFDSVYAVGCPLGNDPIPTYGEVATIRHRVDGESYWMINAPTYIGNSGGGIFDSETHELLGIFSKIYTHGTLRPTIVPHMGLVTPLITIYDWLEEQGYGEIVPVDEGDSADDDTVAQAVD